VGQVAGFAVTQLDIGDFPTRHNYGLALWQNHIERILAGWVGELPVKFYRGREVTGFTQDVAELLSMDEPRKRFAAMMCGLDIRYDLGAGHPLLGRRMPDLDLATANGPLRVFTLLHDARPVLLNLGEPGGFDIAPWADRVHLTQLGLADALTTWFGPPTVA
jgi:hypothetical protein